MSPDFNDDLEILNITPESKEIWLYFDKVTGLPTTPQEVEPDGGVNKFWKRLNIEECDWRASILISRGEVTNVYVFKHGGLPKAGHWACGVSGS